MGEVTASPEAVSSCKMYTLTQLARTARHNAHGTQSKEPGLRNSM